MAEMNRVGRFFVNRSAARRSGRRIRWISENVSIPTAALCLEIGCGNAAFASRFVSRWQPRRYLATDLDPRQLHEAEATIRRRFPAGAPPSLQLCRADMLRLPVPDGSLDLVLAFVSVHHASPTHHDFSKVPRALEEIDRVLRSGGLFVYSEMFHMEPIRAWLLQHGFTLSRVERRFRLESVVARRP
jgi:SAM-dependent methyltransferase